MKSLAPLRLFGLVVWLAAWSAVAVADCTSPDGQEGTIDYNSTTHQFEYCDESDTWQPLGSGGGSLATLSDVSASAPSNGAVLRYNDSASKWESVNVSAAMSTTSILPGWPDRIECSGSSGRVSLFRQYGPANGSSMSYHSGFPTSGSDIRLVFSSGAASAGTFYGTSGWTNFYTDCSGKNISQLYAAGQAFDLLGGTSGESTALALGDRITSGTMAVTANSATSIISLSTAGTTWGYLGSGSSYLPTLSAGRVSATNISSTNLQIGSSNVSCASGSKGMMRVSATTLEYCNGTDWTAVGSTGVYGYEVVTNSVSAGSAQGWYAASCPSGKKVVGGSCNTSNGAMGVETNILNDAYRCYKFNTTNSWTVTAICAQASASSQPMEGGAGVSYLASLTDVSATAIDGGVLRYNASSSEWETVDISTAMSTTSMVEGWPDAIKCRTSTDQMLYLTFPDYTGNDLYYYRVIEASTNYQMAFSSNGSFHSTGLGASSDCDSKSISQLYAEGKPSTS